MKLKLPYWTTKSFSNNEVMLFNWTTNNSATIYQPTHPAYNLKDDDYLDLDFEQLLVEDKNDIEWLIDEKFLIDDQETQSRFNTNPRFDPDALHLILLPAGEACNLDCVYCYEDHNDKSRLKAAQIPLLLNFIKKQNKSRVHIEYFGGEPMLNMSFISKFSEALKQNSIKFSASITTNGTLINDNTLLDLYNANVKSFQITLDGPKEKHNLLRVSTSKKQDSFDSVCHGLRTIQKSQFKDISVILRLNVNHHSIEKYNFIEFSSVIENLIPKNDHRFFILAKAISDYSSANLKDNEKAVPTYCKSSNDANDVLQVFEDYFSDKYRSANAMLLTRQGGYTCYAGNKNSFMITPDLKVRKCTVALNDPINTIGFINEYGELEKNENFKLWIKDYSDSYCDSCVAQKTCQGNSCPLAQIKQNKKICPPIKSNISVLTKQVVKFYEQLNNETN